MAWGKKEQVPLLTGVGEAERGRGRDGGVGNGLEEEVKVEVTDRIKREGSCLFMAGLLHARILF